MAKKQGGIECEFVKKPPKAVQSECPVCLLVLREPYQATCCGYAFCQLCIEKIKKYRSHCPCCKAKRFRIFEDKRLRRSLYEFRIRCINKQQGCQWEGELGQLDNHLNYNPTRRNQREGCKCVKIKCRHCSDFFKRSNILIHQNDLCPRRPYFCQWCRDFASTCEDVTINHWSVCGYYPILCPNKCCKVVHRQNLDSHITNDCPLTIMDCGFKNVGCEVRLPRKDMSEHLNKGVVRHLSLQAVSYKQVVTNMARLKEENMELKQQVMKLTQELQMQQIYIPLCPVEFAMANFQQYMKNGVAWKSPAFYTHLRGYKMRLYVEPNGSDRDKGTHTSASIMLMKGEFDDELKWPFIGQVEIQLLNQDKINGRLTQKINFRDATTAGKRVTEGDESNKILGILKFISHSNLRPTYLKNNCLNFRINSV